MTRWLALLAVVALAGCMGRSPEQRLVEAQNACSAYGFQAGTDLYAQCMMRLDMVMQQQDYQRRMAMAADLQQWSANQQSVTCNTRATASAGLGGQTVTGNSTTTCR